MDQKSTVKLDESIWVIYQDQTGDYWFGSNGRGVYHFDSDSLVLLTADDGLVDNTIRGIQEDKLGNIYIETPKGVSKYDGKQFTTLQIIKSNEIGWKLESDDLWFSCNGSANNIYRYDGTNLYQLLLPKQELKNTPSYSNTQINTNPYSVFSIDRDSYGNLWIGTEDAGVFRFDGRSFLWFGEKELSRLEDGRVPGVRSIIEDRDGYFWLSNVIHKYKIDSVGSYLKLTGIDFKDQDVQMKFPYFMSAVLDNHDGSIWMATYSEGIWNYDGKSLSNYQIKDNGKEVLIISIYQDIKGTIWVGTDNAGVYKKSGNTFIKFKP